MKNKEIERKWILKELPDVHGGDDYFLYDSSRIEAIYLSTNPYVRIAIRTGADGTMTAKQTIKFGSGLVRDEFEVYMDPIMCMDIIERFGARPIIKHSWIYATDDGQTILTSVVDSDTDTEFYYAEVEFNSIEEANAYKLPSFMAGCDPVEVTGNSNWSMNMYWKRTRG